MLLPIVRPMIEQAVCNEGPMAGDHRRNWPFEWIVDSFVNASGRINVTHSCGSRVRMLGNLVVMCTSPEAIQPIFSGVCHSCYTNLISTAYYQADFLPWSEWRKAYRMSRGIEE